VRQAKPGEGGVRSLRGGEEEEETGRNLLTIPCGCESRPAKAGHQPGAGVAWGGGATRPCEAYTARCAGRVMEPRKLLCSGSRLFLEGGRQHRGAEGPGVTGPAGVAERGTRTRGYPRNLGGLVVSVRGKAVGRGPLDENPGPGAVRPAPLGSEDAGRRAVPVSEGDEASREERRGVGVRRSTVEAGEPAPEGTRRREGSTR
jgi:hypothetical protein